MARYRHSNDHLQAIVDAFERGEVSPLSERDGVCMAAELLELRLVVSKRDTDVASGGPRRQARELSRIADAVEKLAGCVDDGSERHVYRPCFRIGQV